jgi:hypothetical protein
VEEAGGQIENLDNSPPGLFLGITDIQLDAVGWFDDVLHSTNALVAVVEVAGSDSITSLMKLRKILLITTKH